MTVPHHSGDIQILETQGFETPEDARHAFHPVQAGIDRLSA
jgi:hypothetical protein